MSEKYIEYWGLKQNPFLLAPDSNMMHMARQYNECLERLKYAVNTNRGGALVVSEDAGFGKTTILLKLIEEMKATYGNCFKYAFVDHPTLTSSQLIAYITACFTDLTPARGNRPRKRSTEPVHSKTQTVSDSSHGQDKLQNLMILKEALIEVKRQGGKSIIIVDEGQMLCGDREILQELRMLINLTSDNDYLHTLILSGQKPLWNEVKSIPEFWQRLPVRYNFVALQLEETRELIKYRLAKAGMSDEREIFTDDAFVIIQKYSEGSPRTIIALADLSLWIGYADRSGKIGAQELLKAINVMFGRSEGISCIQGERGQAGLASSSPETPAVTNIREVDADIGVPPFSSNLAGHPAVELSGREDNAAENVMTQISSLEREEFERPATKRSFKFFFRASAAVCFLLVFAAAYYFIGEYKKGDKAMPFKYAVDAGRLAKQQKKAVVIKNAANVRRAPDILAPKIGMLYKGETAEMHGEQRDAKGQKWYKLHLPGNKVGWIAGELVMIK